MTTHDSAPPRVPMPSANPADLSEPDPAVWAEVAAVDEVGSAMPRRVVVDDEALLLCRDGVNIYAVDENCPHKRLSMAWGVVVDGTIICPHHQYRFRLDTGACDRRRCEPLETRGVRVYAGRVWVARRSVPGIDARPLPDPSPERDS